jgi:hypothetical protein
MPDIDISVVDIISVSQTSTLVLSDIIVPVLSSTVTISESKNLSSGTIVIPTRIATIVVQDVNSTLLPEYFLSVAESNIIVSEKGFTSGLLSSFQLLAAEPDIGRVFIVEVHAGREIEGESWVDSSGAWSIPFSSFTYGEVDAVEEGAVKGGVYALISYTPTASIGACQSTASSFYFDFNNQTLYIHTSGNNSPATQTGGIYDYCIIARFNVCFTNRQPKDNRVIYSPKSVANPTLSLHEVYYLPYLNDESFPTITQGVGDYYIGDLQIQFGSLTFVNDGWLYWAFESIIWHNASVYVKVAEEGSPYSDFETLFIGIVRNPTINDEQAEFEVTDSRVNELRDIPLTTFDPLLPEYQYTEESSYGSPIPIPFGTCKGIIAVQSNQSIYKYKISAYPIEEVTNVYRGGVLLTPSDYSVNLTDATITLVNNINDLVVTCDVKGVKCSSSGTWSELFGDGVFFILNTLNSIPYENIDISSLLALNAARTAKMGFYLDSSMPALDLIRIFQQSAVFHCIPRMDGVWTFKYYTSAMEGAVRVYKEDLEKLGLKYSTDGTYHTVILNYDKNCGTGELKKVTVFDDKVKYRYKEKGVLTVETALYDPTEATLLATFYLAMVKVPPKSVEGIMGMDGFNLLPSDKIIISKTIKDSNGNDITVLADAVYRVLEFQKNLAPASTGFSGVDDSQSYGNYHADTAYQDSHEAVYTDISSVEHADADHGDVAHADVDHGDAYTDNYSDYHTDLGHWAHLEHVDYTMHPDHYDYLDGEKVSTWMGPPEPPFINWYDYGDTGIWYLWDDASGYSDEATRIFVEHQNIMEVIVGHLDTPHIDCAHGDSYADVHTDMSHADSQF